MKPITPTQLKALRECKNGPTNFGFIPGFSYSTGKKLLDIGYVKQLEHSEYAYTGQSRSRRYLLASITAKGKAALRRNGAP